MRKTILLLGLLALTGCAFTEVAPDPPSQVTAKDSVPRQYHNAPLIIGGFAEQAELKLQLGGELQPAFVGGVEYYVITNASSPSTKPELVIRPVDPAVKFKTPWSDQPVDSIKVQHGQTVIITQDDSWDTLVNATLISGVPTQN